ncbi:MAG: hypothetical protein ABIP12_00060 [Terriglobales bacterium]
MRLQHLLTPFLLLSTIPSAADVKIVTRSSAANGQHKSVTTWYIQGQRQRTQYPGPIVTVHQCDAKKQITLNLEVRLFDITALGPDGRPLDLPKFRASGKYTGPIYNYTVTTEDTGERAKVFGFDAWHVRETTITTTSTIPAPAKTVVDYWYIDLPVPTEGCYAWPTDWLDAFVASDPRHQLKRIGSVKRGFPVLKRTVSGRGEQTVEHVVEVTEISTAPLDPQLFEIPKDFQPALRAGGRTHMSTPDTPGNRMKAGWEGFWEGVAKFIF